MPRKNPVRWTQHEETLIAREAERIRADPDAPANRNGFRRARSLASQIILGQRVLSPDRQKTPNAIHMMRDLQGWFATALARSATYGLDAAPETAREETPPAPVDPETARRDELATMAARFLQLVDEMVEAGVKREIAKLQAATPTEELRPQNGPAPQQHALDFLTPPRRRIDIVGLKGNQQEAVLHAPVAQAFDIRFLPADCHLRKRELRGEVILMTKFMRHADQNRYRQMGAALHWANGGVSSVLVKLEQLRGSRGNGKFTRD